MWGSRKLTKTRTWGPEKISKKCWAQASCLSLLREKNDPSTLPVLGQVHVPKPMGCWGHWASSVGHMHYLNLLLLGSVLMGPGVAWAHFCWARPRGWAQYCGLRLEGESMDSWGQARCLDCVFLILELLRVSFPSNLNLLDFKPHWSKKYHVLIISLYKLFSILKFKLLLYFILSKLQRISVATISI